MINQNFFYTQLAFAFVHQKYSYYAFFFFFFSTILISFSSLFLLFIFFLFRKILISFTCIFLMSFFAFLIIFVVYFYRQKKIIKNILLIFLYVQKLTLLYNFCKLYGLYESYELCKLYEYFKSCLKITWNHLTLLEIGITKTSLITWNTPFFAFKKIDFFPWIYENWKLKL